MCSMYLDSGVISSASPPVETMVHSPSSSWMRSHKPSTWAAKPYTAPDWMHSTVVLPSTLRGSTSSTARRAAARPTRASMLMPMPGAMAPPRYSPLADTASQVVAVPKSATMVGPP